MVPCKVEVTLPKLRPLSEGTGFEKRFVMDQFPQVYKVEVTHLGTPDVG